jgi:hypothetical protein
MAKQPEPVRSRQAEVQRPLHSLIVMGASAGGNRSDLKGVGGAASGFPSPHCGGSAPRSAVSQSARRGSGAFQTIIAQLREHIGINFA